jgi:hypothetical protein
MRIDLYTKVVLTVIAVFLGVIALRPQGVVQAQGGFVGVLPMGTNGLFDSRRGLIFY